MICITCSLLGVLADDQIDISSGSSQYTVVIEQMPVEEIVAPITEDIAWDSLPVDPQILDTPVQEEHIEEITLPIEKPLSETPSDIIEETSLVVSDNEQRSVIVDGDIVTIMWK